MVAGTVTTTRIPGVRQRGIGLGYPEQESEFACEVKTALKYAFHDKLHVNILCWRFWSNLAKDAERLSCACITVRPVMLILKAVTVCLSDIIQSDFWSSVSLCVERDWHLRARPDWQRPRGSDQLTPRVRWVFHETGSVVCTPC